MTFGPILGEVSVSDKKVVVNGREIYEMVPYLTRDVCGVDNRYYSNGFTRYSWPEENMS